FSNFLHRKTSSDHWFDSAIFKKLKQLFPGLIDFCGILLSVGPPMKSDNTIILDQNVIRGIDRELAAGESDHQDPAFKCNALCAALAHFSTDWIVDHICAATTGLSFHKLNEVFALIVDCEVCTVLANKIELVIGSCGPNDLSGS